MVFIVSPLYAAWIRSPTLPRAPRSKVFDYTRKTPYLVVTGRTAQTVFTRERARGIGVQLDMGVRVPVCTTGRRQAGEWPALLCGACDRAADAGERRLAGVHAGAVAQDRRRRGATICR